MIASSGKHGNWAFAPRPRQGVGASLPPGNEELLPQDAFYSPVPQDERLQEFLENASEERRRAAPPWLQFRLSTALWLMGVASAMFAVARLFQDQEIQNLGLVLYGTLLFWAPLLLFLGACAVPNLAPRVAVAASLFVLGLLLIPAAFGSLADTIAYLCGWWVVQTAGIAGVWKLFHYARRADL